MAADVHCTGTNFTKQDRLHFVLSNRGGGKAKNITLVINIESSLGEEHTFRIGLTQYKGANKGEPTLQSNKKEDLYTTISNTPIHTSGNYNRILAEIINRLDDKKYIYIRYEIFYNDFTEENKRVTGFGKSEKLNIDQSFTQNDVDEIKEAINDNFKHNFSDLIKSQSIIREKQCKKNEIQMK